MYTHGHTLKGVRRLPSNLLDAIRLFEKSKVLRAGLGDALIDSYAKLKHQDWRSYSASISQWEREHTLDC
jgi:glutamine synthetase